MVQSVPAEPAQPVKSSKEEDGRWYSPIVLKLAQEAKISQAELDAIPGTGYEGRLSKKDIKDYITTKKSGIIPQSDTENLRQPSTQPTISDRRNPPSPVDGVHHHQPTPAHHRRSTQPGI